MKTLVSRRAPLAALLAAALVTVAACATDIVPTAPQTPAIAVPDEPSNLLGILGGDDGDSEGAGLLDGSLLQGILSNLSLHNCDSPDFGSVTKTIGPLGGTIQVGPHSLTIPPGALSKPVAIKAAATAGKYVKVDFEPHGLRFRYRATLRLSLAHCTSRPLLPKVVYVGGSGDLLDILELVPALTDLSSHRVTARLRHFSGYAIAD
jgi:hypothetical protein